MRHLNSNQLNTIKVPRYRRRMSAPVVASYNTGPTPESSLNPKYQDRQPIYPSKAQ